MSTRESTVGSPIRCGIVGTGTFANTHAKAMNATEGMTIVSAVSKTTERCAAFVAQHGGECLPSIDAMLTRDRLDLVLLTTPNNTHATLAEEILHHPQAPRLLLIEKPFCTTPQELEHLAKLPKELQDRIVVDHTRRFDTGYRKLQQIIASGELGTLMSGTIRYHAAWMHKAVHLIDGLRMLAGDFTCQAATLVGTDRMEEDPLITATLQSDSAPEATVVCEGLSDYPYRMTGMDCLFSAGRVRIESNDIFISRLVPASAGTPFLQHAEHFQGAPALASLQNLYASCITFLQSGEKGTLETVGFDEARKTMELMFAAREMAGV